MKAVSRTRGSASVPAASTRPPHGACRANSEARASSNSRESVANASADAGRGDWRGPSAGAETISTHMHGWTAIHCGRIVEPKAVECPSLRGAKHELALTELDLGRGRPRCVVLPFRPHRTPGRGNGRMRGRGIGSQRYAAVRVRPAARQLDGTRQQGAAAASARWVLSACKSLIRSAACASRRSFGRSRLAVWPIGARGRRYVRCTSHAVAS